MRCNTRMRFLGFPLLAVLLLGAAAATSRAPDSPRPVVVLVHGRGQLGADSAGLRAEWKRDLDAALATAGMPLLREEDVRLAWYADVLDAGVTGACGDAPAPDGVGLGTMVRGFLLSLASLVPDSGGPADREARSLLGDVLYIVDPHTRCAAETRLAQALAAARSEKRPVILVAYSLGSVVAYRHLQRSADSTADIHLITVGSPLGVPAMRELLVGEFRQLRAPAGVRRWVNIYDPDDAFAAPLASQVGTAVDRIAKARERGDPHRAGRYLRDDATGAALAAALCDSGGDSWAASCAGLRRAGH